jgi:hypothetical protein
MVNKNIQFLDYKVHEEIKSQSRRDFQEGSGNKLMLEADGFLRKAVSNFELAGDNLNQAEGELHRVLEKLEKCNQVLRQLPAPEPVLAMSPGPV